MCTSCDNHTHQPDFTLFNVAVYDPHTGKVFLTDQVTARNADSARNKAIARLEVSEEGDYESLDEMLDKVSIRVSPF